jgi:hypothetical protein
MYFLPYIFLPISFKSHDSSVGIGLGYGLDDRGSRVRFRAGGLGIFLFTTSSRTALGPNQPPIQWVPGALSLGVKRPGREADPSPPSSVEVKEWVGLYTHSLNTPPWRGAQLHNKKKVQGQLYLLPLPSPVFYLHVSLDVGIPPCVDAWTVCVDVGGQPSVFYIPHRSVILMFFCRT